MGTTTDRFAELERALTDANRQLLERDDELLKLARDRELRRVRDELHEAEALIRQYQADITELNETLAEMRETKAWRVALQVRSIRGALSKLLPIRR